MKKSREIGLYDRLEIYHIEAYYGVKATTARKRKREILEYIGNRKSKVLFVWDLAEFEGVSMNDEADRTHFLEKLNHLV